MLDPGDFWRRIDDGAGRVLVVSFLESWKRVADQAGIEAVDIAENVFASLCRFATRSADGQSRLSVSVFAAYWSKSGAERTATDVFERWVPMTVSSKKLSVPIVCWWIALQRTDGETGHELFRRAESALDTRALALPSVERHRPLFSSWDQLMRS